MKRSEINRAMRSGAEFMKERCFHLPPFAFWGPGDWRSKGEECSDIVRQQLGWDITDFGSDAYEKIGLLMFTIRNGTFDDLKKEYGKVYAEKALIVEPGQVTPTHFHFQKMEDIINRGGGVLQIQFWNSTPEETCDGSDVTVVTDGVRRTMPVGDVLELYPGESVCIPQRIYHSFWGKPDEGTVLVGEVSRVNDDYVDNRFLDPLPRFSRIEEDDEPLHLLYTDYKDYYPFYRDTMG